MARKVDGSRGYSMPTDRTVEEIRMVRGRGGSSALSRSWELD